MPQRRIITLKNALAANKKAPQRTAVRFGKGQQLVERRCQGRHQFRVFYPRADIAPAARYPVAVVFVGDIETAHESDLVIAHEQFPMVAHRKSPKAQAIETADTGAGGDERVKIVRGQRPRAKVIHEDGNLDAASGCGQESIGKKAAKPAISVNIRLQPDGNAGAANGVEHRRKVFRSDAKPFKRRSHEPNIVPEAGKFDSLRFASVTVSVREDGRWALENRISDENPSSIFNLPSSLRQHYGPDEPEGDGIGDAAPGMPPG